MAPLQITPFGLLVDVRFLVCESETSGQRKKLLYQLEITCGDINKIIYFNTIKHFNTIIDRTMTSQSPESYRKRLNIHSSGAKTKHVRMGHSVPAQPAGHQDTLVLNKQTKPLCKKQLDMNKNVVWGHLRVGLLYVFIFLSHSVYWVCHNHTMYLF